MNRIHPCLRVWRCPKSSWPKAGRGGADLVLGIHGNSKEREGGTSRVRCPKSSWPKAGRGGADSVLGIHGDSKEREGGTSRGKTTLDILLGHNIAFGRLGHKVLGTGELQREQREVMIIVDTLVLPKHNTLGAKL
ncbi:hypothetical protein NQ315_001806 [Exocentrus adspersus]|uniref:Uncharacterized protein n=1 Tax=Exocentrus adspersus TaxID=1586481 RepID=A0AAV8WAJ6_9CUCU|nr:hypothetical protein NQ315_001806 [Exocentrus adspersus]